MELPAAIAIAAVLAMAPRVIKENNIIQQGAALSLVTLVVSLIMAEGVAMFTDSNFLGLIFIVMFGGYMLILTDVMSGTQSLCSLSQDRVTIAAGNFADNQTKLFTPDGQEYIRTAAWRKQLDSCSSTHWQSSYSWIIGSSSATAF